MKSDPSMYRPIALLPTLSKCMESIIHKRLLDHFCDNNIISERQAAYLKGDSTVQQILYIVNLIRTSWTKGDITQGVFCDVSAAFDKCWHPGLLAKLKQVKVTDSCHNLFESYLSNRRQMVVVDGHKSETRDIKAGIPQGSRLGPLLWILYIQDIIEDLESEVLLFADDTCIFSTAKDPTITAQILNRDLEKISEWSRKWKVTFNPGKTKDIIFCNNKVMNNSPPILFDGSYVNRVIEHKHLGVWLSSSLSWSRQIQETCMKANCKLSVLRSVHFLDRSTLDVLYKLTVRSVIDYGLPIYFQTLKASEIARLNQIQYRAAKLCTGALHFTSQAKLEKELGWESITERAHFLGLSLFHKIHLHQTRPLIRKCMPVLNITNTRASGSYKIFPSLGLKYSNSFFPFFTKTWNKLDISLRSQMDLSLFKLNLKNKIKPKKYKHFQRGCKKGNSLLTQIRVGRSLLNTHSFSLNLTNNDLCLCSRRETVSHYFNQCFLFQEERQLLYNTLIRHIPNFIQYTEQKKLDVLLYGINLNSDIPDVRNVIITLAVQKFILQTRRFLNPPLFYP